MIRPLRSRVSIDEAAETVTTTFPDGSELVARPSYDSESVARARALGYRGTSRQAVWAMTSQHDLLHTLVAEARGLRCSETLHAVATGDGVDEAVARDEECVVFLVARAMNEGVSS